MRDRLEGDVEMGRKTKHLFRRARGFRKDADGSASIEFVLWMPVFMFILMLTIDASILFMSQSNYWSISRDTARLVSRHAITEEQAKTYAEAAAVNKFASPTASVTKNGQTVTVVLTSPASQLTVFNLFSFATPYQVEASTTQALEPI